MFISRKYTQLEIEEIYKKQGYDLISTYENSNKTLLVKDKEGYICISRINEFKKGSSPSKFHSNNPYTIYNIKHFIELNCNGYELLPEPTPT